jgi:hypothetical protein
LKQTTRKLEIWARWLEQKKNTSRLLHSNESSSCLACPGDRQVTALLPYIRAERTAWFCSRSNRGLSTQDIPIPRTLFVTPTSIPHPCFRLCLFLNAVSTCKLTECFIRKEIKHLCSQLYSSLYLWCYLLYMFRPTWAIFRNNTYKNVKELLHAILTDRSLLHISRGDISKIVKY